MTAFSPSWRERYPDNPQGALLALATYWAGQTEEVQATLWATWYRTDAHTDAFVTDALLYMFKSGHLRYVPILCTGIPYWPPHRFNDPDAVRLLAMQADELRSSLWMDFGAHNPQGVKNLWLSGLSCGMKIHSSPSPLTETTRCPSTPCPGGTG